MGFPVNSSGHYDTEFLPRERRHKPAVVMVGDSFSASFVPHRYHFTTVAERALADANADANVDAAAAAADVYNLGIAATGPREYAYLLATQGMALQPDAVVINLFAGNDVAEIAISRTPGRWLRTWFDHDNVRLFTVPSRLMKISSERNRGGAVPPSGGVERLLATEAEITTAYPWLFDHRLETGTFSAEAYLRIVRERIPVACAPTSMRLAQLFDGPLRGLGDGSADRRKHRRRQRRGGCS